MEPTTLSLLLTRFEPLREGRTMDVRPVSGGLSGADVWRIHHSTGDWALRRWPESQSVEPLREIHALQRHVARQGLTFVPEPAVTVEGRTWTEHQARLWELAPWMPGSADDALVPGLARLRGAMCALARVHTAAASLPPLDPAERPSPGLIERRDRLGGLRQGAWRRLAGAIDESYGPALAEQCRTLVETLPAWFPRLERELNEGCAWRWSLVPCLRDVWRAHVLFVGDDVTGLIDFGAVRRETVAIDVARLLGSLSSGDETLWHEGLAAYESVRPLRALERQALWLFDRANVVLSPWNWLEWLFVERSVPGGVARAAERVEHFFLRGERLKTLHGAAGKS